MTLNKIQNLEKTQNTRGPTIPEWESCTGEHCELDHNYPEGQKLFYSKCSR